MSDLTFNQLIRLFPTTPVYTYESMPKPRRLSPCLAVGTTVAALLFGVGGAWEAAQVHPVGGPSLHTLSDKGLRPVVEEVCAQEFGEGQTDTQLGVDMTQVFRNGELLNTTGNPIRSGDTAEVQCGSYAATALNERNPFSRVIRFIVPMPETD